MGSLAYFLTVPLKSAGQAGGVPDHRVLGRPHSTPLALSPPATDVKFISNPPSLVAAGSVVAAVQGLHLGSANGFLSYHRLTRFLSKVIRCDPVSDLLPHGQGACPALGTGGRQGPGKQGPRGGWTDRQLSASCPGPGCSSGRVPGGTPRPFPGWGAGLLWGKSLGTCQWVGGWSPGAPGA